MKRFRIPRALQLACSAILIFGSHSLLAQDDADEQDVDAEEVAEEEAAAEDADETVDGDEEEMIVTGSYIRRSSFSLPSPMDVISELDIELARSPDLGDIIFDQTYQLGVNANAAPFEHPSAGADDQSDRRGVETFANIRGMGARATMTMMDGHRVPANVQGYGPGTRRTGSDVNNMYPGGAIGRVEIVLDGASALYGSEAVSGVINQIPNKRYEGFRTNYSVWQPIDSGAPNKTFSLTAGSQSEKNSALFAININDTDRMIATERPDFIVSSAGWTGQLLPTWTETGTGNPGDWRVPFRHENGELAPWVASGWAQFQNPSDAPPGWTGNSGPWYFYPPTEPTRIVVDDYDGDGYPDVEEFGWAGTTLADNIGRLRALRRVDPGCGFPFGAGHDSLEGEIIQAGRGVGIGYNDTTKKGNFFNGYLTGNVHGRETRTTGDETGSRGSEFDCRSITGDLQSLLVPSDKEQGMAFFEHRFNDYVTIHGEIVVSRLDYSLPTKDWFGIDEWQAAAGSDPLSPFVAIAIGSNPGNPFRAFADGSNSCTVLPNLPGCDEFTNNRMVPFDDNPNDDNDEFDAITDRYLDQFMSYIDANGNGLYDYLQEAGEWLVYAVDRDGNGLPDRDIDGDGFADDAELANIPAQKNPAFRVVLLPLDADSDSDGVPDRFDPDMHGNGGIRLFEDVRMQNLSGHPKQPYVHESYPWLNDDMTFDQRAQRADVRLRVGTTIQIPDTEWIVDADWVYALNKQENDWLEPVWHWTVNSLRCQGGRDADECWNPFSTAWLDSDPETGELLHAWRDKDDPAWNTALETRHAGLVLRADQRLVGFSLIDVIASTSNLFELWYNDTPVGFAAGIHHRVESEEYRPNQVGAASLGSSIVSHQQTTEETNAIFAEFQFQPLNHPRWGEMELQTAVRYAVFEGHGSIFALGEAAKFNTTIPKIALSYTPTNWMSIRASRTEGFVLPGMFQLFNTTDGEFRDLQTVSDYVCDLMPDVPSCSGAGPGGAIQNVVVQNNSANRSLSAEISELWNTGISFLLLDDRLTLDVDYTDVVFTGRVERIGAAAVVGMNRIGFEEFVTGMCGDTLFDYDNQNRWPPGEYPGQPGNVNEYLDATPQEELDCRAAAALDWVQNHERGLAGAVIKRNEIGQLTEAASAWINQGKTQTRTLIMGGSYSFSSEDIPLIGGDYGNFSTSLSVTKMLELSLSRYAEGSGHAYAGITVDGIGNRNAAVFTAGSSLATPLPPTPEWSVNLGLRWFNGPHTLGLTGRWRDGIGDWDAAWAEIALRTGTRCVFNPNINGGEAEYDADGNIVSLPCDDYEVLPEEFWGESVCVQVNDRAINTAANCDGNGHNPNEFNGMDARFWTEEESCQDQDRNPYCQIASKHYWDFVYSYNRSDFLGLGHFSWTLSIGNIFNTFQRPIPSGAGFEGYMGDIFGRTAYSSISLTF